MTHSDYSKNDFFLLILSSPSGAGKTTLTHRLLEDFPDFRFSVSHTTRKPRKNEVDGQDYHFISEEEFKTMIENDNFIEWALVHGNYYGTTFHEIEAAIEEGQDGLIFDVDYQGARQIKAKVQNTTGVFILPPSLEELHKRLVSRATDDQAIIEKRFKKAKEEIEHYPFFDYLIINDDLQQALADLKGIIHAERSKKWRRAFFAENLLR